MFNYFLSFILLSLFFSCSVENGGKSSGLNDYSGALSKQNTGEWIKPKYASGFIIYSTNDFYKCYLLNSKDTLACYVLAKNNEVKNAIPIPCRKPLLMSSIYSYMTFRIGASDLIAGIDNLDYICDSFLRAELISKKIPELGKFDKWDTEKILRLSPDVIFTWGNLSTQSVSVPDRVNEHCKVVFLNDHSENHPLARAEWIKFMACFFDALNLADSLFTETENKYNTLKNSVPKSKSRPSVFTEVKLSEGWYIPGGQSTTSQLIDDAGGTYLWREIKKSGSLCLSFEEVFKRARNAEFWINLPLIKSKAELVSRDERYIYFNAFTRSSIYNNDARLGIGGGSAYWEEGIVCPDKVLKDLICIFNSSSINSDSLYFYRQLK